MTQENAEEIRNPMTGESLSNDDYLDMGESNDETVGQDEQVDTQESSETNWEESAKYFQSEKDKLSAENQRLKKYEDIGKVLESRPDVVEAIQNTMGGQPNGPEKIVLEEGEFDPWEAYNNPASKSYKHRVQENQEQISQAVNGAVGQLREVQQKEQGMMKLDAELERRGLTHEEQAQFKQFMNQPSNNLGVDDYISLWRNNNSSNAPTPPNNVEAARQTQNSIPQGGVLQGQRPQTTSDDDDMWSGILSHSKNDVF